MKFKLSTWRDPDVNGTRLAFVALVPDDWIEKIRLEDTKVWVDTLKGDSKVQDSLEFLAELVEIKENEQARG